MKTSMREVGEVGDGILHSSTDARARISNLYGAEAAPDTSSPSPSSRPPCRSNPNPPIPHPHCTTIIKLRPVSPLFKPFPGVHT